MLDMSEFYQTEHLKELCDEYLSKMKYTMDNIFQFIELSSKYSLIKITKPIQNLLFQNFKTIFKSDEFLDADKLIIKEIVAIKSLRPEQIFQAIYEWAENRATKKQENSCNENFNMNDEIKIQMQEFLPNIKFKKMTSHFLQNFVVKKDFLFTKDELNDILEYLHSIVTVKITNSIGESIYCDLSDKQKYEIEVIKSLNGRESYNKYPCFIYWDTNCEEPSAPSPLKKRDDVQWYLIYDEDGDIGAKLRCKIYHDDYLIAEMFSKTGFTETEKCKIEIE